jgi:hypothetical protein
MVSQNVVRVLRQVKSMTPEDRRQLLEILASDAAAVEGSAQSVAETLEREGVVSARPQPLRDQELAEFRAWKPVRVVGKPVSQALIEERR